MWYFVFHSWYFSGNDQNGPPLQSLYLNNWIYFPLRVGNARNTTCKDYVMICLSILYKTSLIVTMMTRILTTVWNVYLNTGPEHNKVKGNKEAGKLQS